ncbi:MarR family winged helix-turn-helix transcriptional regulator [Paenibacillus thermotolerans]|uniref:MarR family winged helix-turn-helix transcriptional regulator n=1 Tax=Paenibacillus thermotolerans TaxID=3027807 RepID=UPI002368A48E|nr:MULTISPECIES: MarR family transcriptional regulator [unclassified Paenibacillus]
MDQLTVEQFRYFILAAERHGARMLQELLAPLQITPSQAEVIGVLEKREPLSLKELGELLICENGSPSRLVDRMVKDDMIQKTPDPNDSRYVKLQLTEKGRLLSKRLHSVVGGTFHEEVEKTFTKQELEQTIAVMAKLLAGSPLSETLKKRGYLP